ALGAVDIVQDALALHIKSIALGRGVQLPRAALEQARAQPRFQAIDQFAHCRWRQFQSPRRSGKSPGLDHGGEDGHLERTVDILARHY
ncbi:MAG: hypothetical protein RLZZ237_3773, partial [Pseudomonadota bacterium]